MITILVFFEPSFPEAWKETEEHAVLTPTRHFIWKEYLSKAEYRDRRAEVVRAKMEAVAEECEFRFVGRRYDTSPQEMNERLIQRLRLRLLVPRAP